MTIEDIRYVDKRVVLLKDESRTVYAQTVPTLQYKINGQWIDVPTAKEES